MHLVTGGSGYFGEVLVKLLLSKGLKVRVFDLNPPSEEIRNKIDFLQGDIRDRDCVEQALNGAEFVHHNVAQVPLAKNKGNAPLPVNNIIPDGTKLIIASPAHLAS